MQLLAEGLGELLVVDQAHVLGDLAEHLAGALLLLVEQQFELLVGDVAEVDQDLSDAALGHGRSCRAVAVSELAQMKLGVTGSEIGRYGFCLLWLMLMADS